MTDQRTRRLGVDLFPGFELLDVFGPAEMFGMLTGTVEIVLVAQAKGPVASFQGPQAVAHEDFASAPQLELILVPGGFGTRTEVENPRMAEFLRRQAQGADVVMSVCTGASLLARAGLLDGRRATTHWDFCDQMRSFRPAVQLEPDAIFVADPPYYTSAGVTAGIDLCLSLVEADCGPQLALAVARNLVLFMRRPGGQTQYSAGLNVQAAATSRLRQLIADIHADPCGDLSVPRLAERAAMSERTFSRVFQKEIGIGPAAFVETARVNRAKALLETSDWPLARVADRAGFGSVEGLHRAFNKRVGVTPGEYRERYGHAS
jgi:transcriptional regulator GlxA family with amidase domain